MNEIPHCEEPGVAPILRIDHHHHQHHCPAKYIKTKNKIKNAVMNEMLSIGE